jgi:hypothetical protein
MTAPVPWDIWDAEVGRLGLADLPQVGLDARFSTPIICTTVGLTLLRIAPGRTRKGHLSGHAPPHLVIGARASPPARLRIASALLFWCVRKLCL